MNQEDIIKDVTDEIEALRTNPEQAENVAFKVGLILFSFINQIKYLNKKTAQSRPSSLTR